MNCKKERREWKKKDKKGNRATVRQRWRERERRKGKKGKSRFLNCPSMVYVKKKGNYISGLN